MERQDVATAVREGAVSAIERGSSWLNSHAQLQEDCGRAEGATLGYQDAVQHRTWLVLDQLVRSRVGRRDADRCATRWWPLGRQLSAMLCCETRAPIAQDWRRKDG
jgi:hypothetical protein